MSEIAAALLRIEPADFYRQLALKLRVGEELPLDEVVGRVENPDLNAQLDALRSQIAALRIRVEEPLGWVEADRAASQR